MRQLTADDVARKDWITDLGILVVGLAAAILTFTTLRGLAETVGFRESLFGVLQASWLLPVTIDAAGVVAARVWLRGAAAAEAVEFARKLTWVCIAQSVLGNAGYHLMVEFGIAPPWWVVVLVTAVPPSMLGAVVHLGHLVRRPGGEPPSADVLLQEIEVPPPPGVDAPVARVSLQRVQHGDEPTAVYRVFDTASTLLYVGVSMDVPARMADHRRTKPWWSEVAEVTVEEFPDRSAALAAEAAAIVAENPRYNANRGTRNDVWNVGAGLIPTGADQEPTAADREKVRPIALPASDEALMADVREWAVDRAAVGADRPSRDDMIEAYGIGATRARKLRNILAWADTPAEPPVVSTDADREPTGAAR